MNQKLHDSLAKRAQDGESAIHYESAASQVGILLVYPTQNRAVNGAHKLWTVCSMTFPAMSTPKAAHSWLH